MNIKNAETIKIQVFEVSCKPSIDSTFTIKAEMLDLSDTVPSTAKNYVMISFEEYKKLTGELPLIEAPPKRKRTL